jgi:hypothetical protein
MTMTLRRFAVAAILVLSAANAGAQQGQIEEAKRLYASAAFENALAALERLDGAVSRAPDVLQYKTLCLLALGRSTEAQSVADTLVSSTPAFVPSSGEEFSPRFINLLTDTRRRLLPEIAKRMFTDAREQLRAKNQSVAKKQFEQVLLLAKDPSWSNQSEAEDLRTLASGFLDLMDTAAPSPAPSVNVVPQAPLAGASEVPAQPDRIAGNNGLLPPTPVTQSMPKWQPRDAVTAQRRYAGSIRVRIGTDGHVVSAVMEVPTDPNYDKQLVEAAKSWTYKPATRNGEPVEVEKVVTFFLRTN